MITTNGNVIHLVDSFTGQLKSTLTVCHENVDILTFRINNSILC